MKSRSTILALTALTLVAGALATARAEEDEEGPKRLPTATEELVRANNLLALELYGKLAKEPGNVVLSPENVARCLGLVSAGARGETAAAIAKTLHHDGGARLHRAHAALEADLEGVARSRGHRLDLAMALWNRKGQRLDPELVAIARQHYSAPVDGLDFGKSPAAAIGAINSWVSGRTGGEVPALVGPADVSADTRLVVTSATYFKAGWEVRFDPKKTKDGTFTTAKGEKKQVPFLHRKTGGAKDGCRASFADGFTIVELPYLGRELALDLFVPSEGQDLPAVEKLLTAERLATELAQLGACELQLALPKFAFSSRSDLGRVLAELGMADAFSPAADFSGIDGAKGTALSSVVHEARIEVNEEGTEAAAATAAAMSFGGPEAVTVDRPFIFLVRDTRTGSILFLGRVEDPSAR